MREQNKKHRPKKQHRGFVAGAKKQQRRNLRFKIKIRVREKHVRRFNKKFIGAPAGVPGTISPSSPCPPGKAQKAMPISARVSMLFWEQNWNAMTSSSPLAAASSAIWPGLLPPSHGAAWILCKSLPRF